MSKVVKKSYMHYANDAFVEFLRSRRGQSVYLKPYWGNSGDELIWMGNEILLDELGLNRVLNPQKAEIILWPGGNPTMWESNLEGWQDCWARWPKAEFVVGPTTFQGDHLPWQKLLKTTRAKIAGLFARDPASYQNLLRLDLAPSVQTGLGHDPAFYLKGSSWISEVREGCLSEYILASFRNDHESATRRLDANRLVKTWPISSIYYRYKIRRDSKYREQRANLFKRASQSSLPVVELDASLMGFQSFLEWISRAGQVHTDRLHCMILSVLLGKEVFAYPTAYGKLEAVYEHSIKPWASVQFFRGWNDNPTFQYAVPLSAGGTLVRHWGT